MSGHNKWSKIKREKAVTDAKKSRAFSKMSRAITVAAKEGGGDIDSNPSLRLAIEKAKEVAMPKDNIQKAIDKGLGITPDGRSMEEAVYEGFGPFGVAFLVKTVTDNKNRTVSELRGIFSRAGGSLGGSGSTAYIFTPDPKAPSFEVSLEVGQVEKVENLYEELSSHDDVSEVFANFKSD